MQTMQLVVINKAYIYYAKINSIFIKPNISYTYYIAIIYVFRYIFEKKRFVYTDIQILFMHFYRISNHYITSRHERQSINNIALFIRGTISKVIILDDDYLTSNSKEFICFSLGLSDSESLSSIFLAHLWDFLFKFF